jgi:phytoene synthase
MNQLDRSDVAECRALLANGSRTFLAGSHLLPGSVADAATVLYAFCRVADDAIDSSHANQQTLAELRNRLDLIYSNLPGPCAVDRALAVVVQQFRIKRELLESLLQGFEWDISGHRYDTLDELYGYAARVAGTVGAMMSLIMGQHDSLVLARAIEFGIAMQFSNIARDVGEDARAGRVYLPIEWFRSRGIDVDRWLADPTFSAEIGEMIEQLLLEADILYRRGRSGIGQLPLSCQPAIFAVGDLYAEIGYQVARNGFDSVSQRARVPGSRKLVLCVAAVSRVVRRQRLETQLAHPATRFLSEVAPGSVRSEERATKRRIAPWYRLDQQAEDLVDLFLRLEQRDAAARVGSTMRQRV